MNPALPASPLRLQSSGVGFSSNFGVRPPRRTRLKRQTLYLLGGGMISGILLLALFLIIGSDPVITMILCSAWMMAWAAVAVAGGFQTIVGWFTFFPFFHFLLFSLPLKVGFWEEAESRLAAPASTSLVMLLFYTGLFFAAWLSRVKNFGVKPICPEINNPAFYKYLAWLCFVLGTAAYFVVQFAQDPDGEATAGQSGVFSILVRFQNFSVAAYIFYAWKAEVNVLKQPPFWLFLISGLFLGTLASAKGATSEPMVFALVAMCSIYGFRSWKALLGFAVFGVLLSSVIYPIMHYARGLSGSRDGTIVERISVMASVTTSYLSDPRTRAAVDREVSDHAAYRMKIYLPETIGLMDRFIMIGPTDLLVAGVDESSDSKKFHGFELFRLALGNFVPKFLNPDKGELVSSEFLADIAGTRNKVDRSNPTWGVPAELYYSFGFPGVFIGSFAIEFGFFTILTLAFGNRTHKSVWFCLVVVVLNMANSCMAIDILLFIMLPFVVTAVVLCKIASWLSNRGQLIALS